MIACQRILREKETTYSLTLCFCKGCRYELPPIASGDVVSDRDALARIAFCRMPVGLKSPGEDIGVLCAVLTGTLTGEGRWAGGRGSGR